jgi:hypothetical protein
MSLAVLWQTLGFILATFFFSFLWLGDSIFYDISERFFIAATVCFSFFAAYTSLQSSLADIANNPLLIVPVIIGLFAFSRLTRYRWMARYPVSILSGIGVGIAFGLTLRSSVINAAVKSVSYFTQGNLIGGYLSGFLFWFGFITTITYFMYSKFYSNQFHDPNAKLYWFMRIGRIFMMASFGWLMNMGQPSNPMNYVVIILRRMLITAGIVTP